MSQRPRRMPSRQTLLVAAAASLAGLAALNRLATRRAERRHPPEGRFLEVDGVRLHMVERGAGPAVLLVHGNVVSGSDFETSGVAEALARDHRVVMIDRPGFGWSLRPRGPAWTALQQARLLGRALDRLGIERPVIVGHSWGALVALAMALDRPAGTAGLALISGYYFPTLRLDSALVAPAAVPVLGDLLRHTVGPLLGRLQMPALKRLLFAPAPVPRRFHAEYATDMELRPSQARATAMDGTVMVPSLRDIAGRYGALRMPVTIIAGEGDRIVAPSQARRLHAAVPGSRLLLVPGAGHMVHHLATRAVAAAIAELVRRPPEASAPSPAPAPRPERQEAPVSAL